MQFLPPTCPFWNTRTEGTDKTDRTWWCQFCQSSGAGTARSGHGVQVIEGGGAATAIILADPGAHQPLVFRQRFAGGLGLLGAGEGGPALPVHLPRGEVRGQG